MALKNQYSRLNAKTNVIDRIQKILGAHSVRKLMFDYEDDGRISALTFSMLINSSELTFKMPASYEKVAIIMYSKSFENCNEQQQRQAYQTAWANVRDWLDAQMVLVDYQMARLEQIFLPFMVMKNGSTVFEALERGSFQHLQLNDGK